jgi:hypothetical protein
MKLLTPFEARRRARPGISQPYSVVPPFVGGVGTQVYSAGVAQFVIPSGTTVIRAKGWGAAGAGNGTSRGGAGAFIQGDFAVRTGDILLVRVGGGGTTGPSQVLAGAPSGEIPGSPAFRGRYGGGLVSLWRRSILTGEETLLLVAGSGGAANADNTPGRPGVATSGSAQDGSQTAGGAGSTGTGTNGIAGGYLRGGNGTASIVGGQPNNVGGGAGDGYYGGGGGHGAGGSGGTGASGPGGGGSCYAYAAQVTNVTRTSGSNHTPPNTGDANYGGSAGQGTLTDGNGGRIVLLY